MRATSSVRASAARITPTAPTPPITAAIDSHPGQGVAERDRGATAWADSSGSRTSTGTGRARPQHASSRAEMDDVAGVEAVGDARTRRAPPAGRRARRRSRCPTISPVGQLDADPLAERRRARPGTAGRCRRAARRTRRAARRARRAGRCRRRVAAAPSGAHPTLRPMPTTTAAAAAPAGRGCRPACARRRAGRSATSASATTPATRAHGVDGGQRRPAASARPDRAGTSRNRIDTSRFAPGGASHRRSSRPRPAVWWSA